MSNLEPNDVAIGVAVISAVLVIGLFLGTLLAGPGWIWVAMFLAAGPFVAGLIQLVGGRRRSREVTYD